MAKSKVKIITQLDIENLIDIEQYYFFPNTTCTVCALTTKSGHTVIGESHKASPEGFDFKEGERLAKADALSKLWEMEVYYQKATMGKSDA